MEGCYVYVHGWSRFLGRITIAWSLKAVRAALTILFFEGEVQVDSPDICKSCQPGQHIRHFQSELFVRSATQSRCQFSELLCEPEKSPGIATRPILRSVETLHLGLEMV